MLWMPLTLYLVMLVTSFVVLTWHDTRNVWQAMDATLDFAVARLEQYFNAMSNERAKSEIRLLDKTAELNSRIAETRMITNEQLDRYAYAQRLTGIVILDADMNAVIQTTIDGDTAAALHAILQKPTVREIVDYPVKAYMTRTQVGDRTVDFAAVAREDAPGLVVAYAEREEEDASDMKLETLFSGFTFAMNGTVTVSDGKTIIASNSAEIVGHDVKKIEEGSIPRAQWDESGRLHIVDGMTAWSGKRTAFENYSVYAMFPDLAVYNSRNTILLYGTLIYMGIWLCFAWLRAQQSRRALERNSEQARIISAISEIYCFTFLVNVQRGTVRIIKHPVEQLMKMDCTWSMNEVVQMQAAQNVAPDFREAFISYCDLTTLAQRLKENPNLTLEFRDPKDKVYLMTTLPQNYDRRGRLESVLMVTQDVTAEKERERDYQLQLKKTAEDAERANIVKTDFLRRMSHDIRTPLNGIIGLLEIDEAHFDNIDLIRSNHEKMMISANHLLSLINDVLQMSKMEDGSIELARESIDLLYLTKDIVTIVVDRALEAGIRWNYERGKTVISYRYIYGSPVHLRQIFLNIYSNCIKYNRHGGTITTIVDALRDRDGICRYRWTISDTGVGMSQEFLSHIFEPFSQEKNDARSIYQDTGLGMSIVKNLVDLMGGTIAVTSKEGVGSTFVITLPFEIAPTPSDAPSPEAHPPRGIKGLHLLLAEDNELNAEIAAMLLQDQGAKITVVSDGAQAVEAFQANPAGTFDAILMDVMMPVLDGIEATKQIRSQDHPDASTIPIIAMTANAFREDEQKCLAAGMNAHLAKPLQMKKVIETIEMFCR